MPVSPVFDWNGCKPFLFCRKSNSHSCEWLEIKFLSTEVLKIDLRSIWWHLWDGDFWRTLRCIRHDARSQSGKDQNLERKAWSAGHESHLKSRDGYLPTFSFSCFSSGWVTGTLGSIRCSTSPWSSCSPMARLFLSFPSHW